MAIGIQDQYFGTEIEMTGITRQRAAEKVAELFGTRAVCDGGYYGVWSVTDQEGKKWKFMYDGSIYTERRERGRMVRAGSEYSTEMVSPKLSYGEMGKLQEVVRCLRHHGAKVNASCGQHVHVDASNHTPRSLKCPFHYVFQRGHPVQGIEGTDIKGTGVLPEGAPHCVGEDPPDAKQHHFHGKVETGMVWGQGWKSESL